MALGQSQLVRQAPGKRPQMDETALLHTLFPNANTDVGRLSRR